MAEPVIDAHVHLYPDALAAKVTPLLGGRFGNEPSFDGTVSGCCRAQAAAGIVAALNLPVATDPHQVAHTNAFWRAYVPGRAVEQNGVTVFSLAAFHPALPDRIAALEEIRQDGFTGVKFHPEYQSFRFNDAVMDDVWAAMSEWGLVAYLHAGGERVFKPPFHSTPDEILTLHRRFPNLRIAAAHLGGFEMWDEAEELLVGQDVFLDLSHTFFWMPHEQILRMIRRHGVHRVLFGTDAPWQDPGLVREALLALPLTAAERRAILFENANRLFRLGLAG